MRQNSHTPTESKKPQSLKFFKNIRLKRQHLKIDYFLFTGFCLLDEQIVKNGDQNFVFEMQNFWQAIQNQGISH